MKRLISCLIVLSLMTVWGCAGYEYKPVPFKAAEAYPNHVTVAGAVIAATAWSDKAAAEKAFGFDIRGAGLTPVQIVMDNKGSTSFIIVPDQTLLRDAQNNLWNILPAQVAYDRIDKEVRLGRLGGEAARQGALAGAAGAVIGAAFGIIAGTDIAEAAGKGATAGVALGAVMGGAEGYNDPRSRSAIRQDLQNRSLQDKPFEPKVLSHGFLFFPGEVTEPTVLRLKLREIQSGVDHILELALNGKTE